MNTQNIFYQLRIKSGLSQDELAEKAFATRPVVSRWGNRSSTHIKMHTQPTLIQANMNCSFVHILFCQDIQ